MHKELGWISNFNQSIWHHHMKDHVEMDHLTQFDAFMLNRDQAMDPGWKFKQMSLNSWQCPQNHVNSHFFFTVSVLFIKMGKHSDFPLSYFQIVSEWLDFTVTKLQNVYMGLRDTVKKLETFVWILSHVLRAIAYRSLFNIKASNLVKWSISMWSFMWWCQ